MIQGLKDIKFSKRQNIAITDTTNMGLQSWGDGLAEWTELNSLFVHRPGIETSLASLDFKTNLFLDVFYLEKAQGQHDNLCENLRDLGIDVVTSQDLVKFLKPADLKKFVGFNDKFSEDDKFELLENYIEDHKQLDILLTEPQISRMGEGELEVSNSFTLNSPLGNFFYSRDPIFQTGENNFVLSNLKYRVRRREIDVMELLFNQIPKYRTNLDVNINYKVPKNETIEGGEVVPIGDTLIIGVESHRTTIGSVYDLMENNAIGHSKIAVVISPVVTQEEMHIDTWFNVIDEDLFVGADRFFSNKVEMLLYERDPESGEYNLLPEKSDFFSYLVEDCGMEYMPLNDKEQKNLMSNGLTIGPRKYIMIDGKSTSSSFSKRLESNGVEVIPVGLDELTDGHGGAHCMTQPLSRKMDKRYQK